MLTRDALGRVIQIKGPEGWSVKQRFDEEGHLVEVSELQRLLRIRRANFHKPVEWEENGTVIRLKYDTEGRLTGVQNESGEQYSYTLDACGRVMEQVDFDGSVCRYSYDAAGRITHKELGSGRFSIFTHDAAGRVLELRHSDGSFVRFTYEPTGEVRTAENESGTVAFERDPLGRVTRSLMGEEYWVSSVYSAAGSRTEMQTSLGGQARMMMDALGRVVGMQCGHGPTPWWMALQYDARGEELGRQLPGRLSVERSYDRAGRPLERRTHGLAVAQTRSYRWGVNDKLEAIVDAALGTTRYTYDGRGHIVSQVSTRGEVQHRTLGAAANTQRTSGQTVSHVGPGGRLAEREGTRYVYDADGHLIEKRTAEGLVWTYAWNGTGTLREVQGPKGLRVRFSYDAFARRTRKQVFRPSEDGQERPESETTYVWDGHQLVHELTQGKRPITWFWQPGAFTPSAQEDASGRYSIVTDHLGTPTELYAEDGRLAWKMQMDLFGVAQVDTPLTSCQWRWPGQYEDPETGLYYNRFRYYDPSIGTYLSKDPLGLAAGLHRYAYVHDPMEWIDPLGLIELQQVSYHGSDNPFSQHMKNYLQGLDDASFKEIQSRNVALFQMKDGSIVPFVSESGAHSEAKGLAQLNHEDIVAVYSERKPCPSGKIKVGCEQKLEMHLGKDVPVYWSYDHDGKGGAVDQLATKNVRNAKKKMRTGC